MSSLEKDHENQPVSHSISLELVPSTENKVCGIKHRIYATIQLICVASLVFVPVSYGFFGHHHIMSDEMRVIGHFEVSS